MTDAHDEEIEFFEYDSSLADVEVPTIRLLVLWPPGDDAVDGYVHCSLSEHPLHDCPPYEALSYTWGLTQERGFIICNGRPHDITSNLYQILVDLRGSEQRVLWIDQISINQQDDREKSQQVKMMRDIYHSASQTIAWLGHPASYTQRAFETLHKLRTAGAIALQNRAQNGWGELDLNSNSFLTTVSRDPRKYWGIAAPERNDVKAVYATLASPWFTRMWIIQEAIVPQHIELRSGRYSISLNHFIFAAYVLQLTTLGTRDNLHIVAKGGMDMLQTMATCRYSYRSKDLSKLGILRLLCQCRQFQATDQRDRLFALYGLTSTPLADLSLTADYTIDVRDTLTSAYVKLMRSDRSVRLLELSESSSETDLPSWIPPQRKFKDPRPYPLSSLYAGEQSFEETWAVRLLYDIVEEQIKNTEAEADPVLNPFSSAVEDLYRVNKSEAESIQSLDSPLSIELLENGILKVEAQFLDRVAEVSPIIITLGTAVHENSESAYEVLTGFENTGNNEGSTLFEGIKEVWGLTASFVKIQLMEWRAFISALTSMDVMVTSRKRTAYYQSESAILTAYRNTVCAGSLAPEQGKHVNRYGWTEQESIEAFSTWRQTIKSSVKIDKLKKRVGVESPAGNASLFMVSMSSHASYDVNSRLMRGTAMNSVYGRRLAWTARGHLALVPARTSVNDHIFAIQGSQMPFVLRSLGAEWKMLGPTYIDGMMKGELHDDDAFGPIRLL